MKHSPAHMELFYTAENKPIMIEVGARLLGGITPLLFKECYEDLYGPGQLANINLTGTQF